MPVRGRVHRGLAAAGAAVLIAVSVAAPASAVSQITGPFSCLTNTYVEMHSTTKGATYHSNSANTAKVYKGNFGSWTYRTTSTGRSMLTYVQVDAAQISSSGGTCR